jgi:predicted dehydrogenase
MKKLRAAVVGVGYLGNFHAQKYKNNPQVELVGVFDVNQAQAKKIATDLQVGVFEKLSDLPGRVDLVTVASSTQSHFEVAEFLINNGIHVNVEKPITAHSDQAKKLIQLAKEKKVTLTVGHIERFNPAFLKWKEIKGTPRYMEFERMGPFKARGADVSVIHDLMIHDIDLLLSLKPGPLKSIQAQGAKVLSQTFDWAVVWLGFESGLKVCLKASRVSPTPARLARSYDAESQWTIYLGSNEVEQVRFGNSAETPMVPEKVSTEKVDGLQQETNAFIDAVLNNKAPFITGEDGLAALELVERICSELTHV